jgi:VWFA-related protein
MKRSVFAFIIGIYLLFAIADSGLAQNKSAKKDDKNAETQTLEIKANLLILDNRGNPLGDIKPEEIKIFEDGAEQKITRLTKKEPVRLGLVMDNTGSLRSKLETVIEAGKTVVDNLRAGDEAFIVRFSGADNISEMQDWTNDKFKLKSALDELFIEGGLSAVVDAVYVSAEKMLESVKNDDSKRYALVLVSDGEDAGSRYKEKQLFELLENTPIQVFTLAFITEISPRGNPKLVENFVQRLALETGGAAFPLVKQNNPDARNAELSAALRSIIAELRAQFVVEYISTNQKRDGGARKLTVQIADGASGEKRSARVRESFIVPVDKK